MMKFAGKRQSGYIVLMSVLVISAVFFAAVFASAASSYYLQSNSLDWESRQRSFFLAWSCLQMARLRIIQNPNAPEAGDVAVGGNTCRILSIALNIPAAGQITIKSQAVINNAAANLQMVVSAADLSLISWEDLDSS